MKIKTFKLTLAERLSIIAVEREMVRDEMMKMMGLTPPTFPGYSPAAFERWAEFTEPD